MMFGGRCAARPTTVGAIRRNARTAAESRLITVWPTAVLDRSVTAVAKRIGGLVEEGGGNFGSSIGRGYLMTSGLLAWPESGGLQRRSSAAARSRRSNAGSPGSDLPHHGPEPGHLHAGERQREGVNPLIAGGAIGIAHPSARSAATSGLAPSGRPRLELRGPRRGGIVLCGQKQPCVRLNSVGREPRRTLTRRRKRPIWGSMRALKPVSPRLRVELHALAERFAQKRTRVFLFGSAAPAWPLAPAGADLDLGYETDPTETASGRAALRRELALAVELLPTVRPIDLVDFSTVTPEFRQCASGQMRELIDGAE